MKGELPGIKPEAVAQVKRLNSSGNLPRYCTAELSRHGKVCVYFRVVGRTGRVRMRAPPESAAFYEHYAALLDGGAFAGKLPAKSTSKPRTWSWLCEQYFQTMAFRSLASPGQGVRRRALEATYMEPAKPGSCHLLGDCPAHRFKAGAVRVLRDRKVKWRTVDGEPTRTNLEAANSLLKYIRGVLDFAKEEFPELVERNWAKDVDYFSSATEGFHTWTLDEVSQYEMRHPIGTKARLAMALGLYTGQRRGDAVRLGPIMQRDGMLQVVQEKNRRRRPVTAWVPIAPALQVIIDTSRTGDLFYLVQDNGQPYTKESFGNLFRTWCDQAGLHHCSFHGLRKACVVRLILDDCTPHQIMAVTGHQTLKEIDRYARKYMRRQAAIQILDAWLRKNCA